VLGGRWKPLQYWYKSAIFTDVMATCGSGGRNSSGSTVLPLCCVNNDLPTPFKGNVAITAIDFASGKEIELMALQLDMVAGVGVTQRFHLDSAVDGSTTMIHAVVKDAAGVVVNNNYIPFTEPKNMKLPKADVKFAVALVANLKDGSIDITVTTDKVALYVTFTTLAQGRFSDNAFVMVPGTQKIQFLPIKGFEMPDLTEVHKQFLYRSLRVKVEF
jgi:hypothetical protein